MKLIKPLMAVFLASAITSAAHAGERPAGEPILDRVRGMEIAAVYLEPIDMSPRGMGLSAKSADVHLEADIHALAGNKNGFGAGEWIPYLTISYTLVNDDTHKSQQGTFMPMVAGDGPHYGANIKMLGVGNYTLTFHIDPPSKGGLYRHKDAGTGVGKWFSAFDASYKFKYTGLNSKS